MTAHLAWALSRARRQSLALVADVSAEQMHLQSRAGERHPAWLLGHLLLADIYLLALLSVEPLTDGFQSLLQRYGPTSEPVAQAADSKDSLVERLARANALRVAQVEAMAPSDLARPLPDSFLAQSQPTIGHHLCSLVFHEGYHSGQLASWRRAHGFAPVRWALGPQPPGAARPEEIETTM